MMRKTILICFVLILGLSACNRTPSAPPEAGNGERADSSTPFGDPFEGQPQETTSEISSPTPTELPGEPYPIQAEPESGDSNPGPTQDANSLYPAPGQGINDCEIHPPTPQDLLIPTNDGLALAASYFPPGICNAPVAILMHQAGDSKASWEGLATWLQNRPAETGSSFGNSGYPVQGAMFPAIPADLSFGVLTFDFRGYGESPGVAEPDGIRVDARNAIDFARMLPGIDPDRIITIGASIGADAAVDGCVSLEGANVSPNQAFRGCIGALSLSPGNYLGVSYADAVNALGASPHHTVVYCVAAENDGNSPGLCLGDYGPHQSETIYPGSDHGIKLIESGRSPDIGMVILNFILASLAAN